MRDYGTAKWEGGNPGCDHFVTKLSSNKSTLHKNAEKKKMKTGIPYKDICSKCGAKRIDKQLGLEETPKEYVQNLVEVFREVRRVLRDDGTIWLNLGDSYAGSGKASGQKPEHKNCGKIKQKRGYDIPKPTPSKEIGLKPKDLIGIPWMIAFVLRDQLGLYLRQDIIWSKPNPMPSSVTDRCTTSHEYIFLLSKSAKYYYNQDAIKTEIKEVSVRKDFKTPDGWDTGKGAHGTIHKKGREKGYKGYKHRGKGDKKLTGHSGNFDVAGRLIGDGKANKRSVWEVATKPFSEAHYAVFPPKLIEDCIKAGCPVGGIVLDPFMGAGTTFIVARKQDKNCIGIELSEKNIEISNRRIAKELGMWK